MGQRTLAVSAVSLHHRAYRLLSRALALPLLAWLWWRGRHEPGYRHNLRHRLGFIPIDPESFGCIWLHAASVGEVQAMQPLLHALLKEWPAHALVVSTQTPTGARALHTHWGDRIRHVYAPLDTPGATARFLRRLRPRLLVLVERELWPEWLLQCRQNAVPVALVNARLSERSHRTYKRWPGLMRPVWASITVACAEGASFDRLHALGVPNAHLRRTGNLKFDVAPPAFAATPPMDLPGRTLVVAGSTHEGDETEWLSTWTELSPLYPDWLLVLVPRHPQRFDEVAARLDSSGLTYVRRTSGKAVTPGTQVLLVDVMGELMQWYPHAALCFVGGTLAPVGGHNPLEPMLVGQPVLFGPHTENAEWLFDEIVNSDAGECVRYPHDLPVMVERWVKRRDIWRDRVVAARKVVARHRGSTERTMDVLRPLWYPADGNVARMRMLKDGTRTCWFDPDRIAHVAARSFDPAAHASATALATGSGRGQAMRIEQDGHGMVLRHYRRGGLMARLSDDRFWREVPHDSRAMREYNLLRLMRSWNLPVPEPIAASHRPHGLFYEADIIVGLIPDSANMVQWLQRRPLEAAEWKAVGGAIRRLHDRQVFHADLNAHNLLLDAAGRAWVVDFDKCEVRRGDDWKQANLDRLLRSLRKEVGRVKPYHWNEGEWPMLMSGYVSPPRTP